MAYFVHITDAHRTYLNGLPLSDRAKQKVENFIEQDIANVNDAFRNDPDNRPWPDDIYFQMDFLFLDVDESGNKSFHKITFVVNDESAAVGVLLLVWIDCQ